jgi:precorrin-2 C20-methyltransferase/precorrin-3B C17-methyltransferase
VSGTLYGIGLGPGDPELVTVKAARIIGEADVVAYHSARHGRSIARSIAEPYLRAGQIEEKLVYPVTVEETDHPDGYQGAIDEFYREAAERLAAHLAAGRTVALLAEGDPLFYSSYMHMHKRLASRFNAEVVPGVTSVSAASAALAMPLVERDEVLTVLPGTLPADELAERLASTDAAAILKLGRTFPAVRDAMAEAGRLQDAYYIERASSGRQKVLPAADVDPDEVPYFSIAVLPSPLNQHHPDARDPGALSGSGALGGRGPGEGSVTVVGLGPGDQRWTTPEVRRELRLATDLVGYGPYIDRVDAATHQPHQRRHRSDNRVEAERAEFALDLALRGRRVAVVSSGDPGVFAMGAAVLEVADDPRYADVPVRVLPGMTAANAVASRVGAPLGHDYAVISLSDRLKPWDVVERRIEAVAAADMAIAVYNPASKSRTWQVGAMKEALLRHRSPETPVVVGRDVAGPQESVRVVPLGELDPAQIDMRCLLIIGSSTTTLTRGGTVFTPRTYRAAQARS